MEHLKELVNVINRNKVKSIRILDPKDKTSRVSQFYKRIGEGDLNTDEEAADFFFNSTPKDAQYRKLKARLRDLLFNTAFFVDVNNAKFSSAQKAFYTCQKNLITIQILLGRYARNSAIELAKSTLRKSMKFEFTEISLDLCKKLREHNAFKTGKVRDFEKYSKLLEKYKAILEAEDQAMYYVQLLSLSKVTKANTRLEAIKVAHDGLEKLDLSSAGT